MKLFSSAVGEIIKFKNKDKPIVLRPALQYIKENIISKGMIGVEVGVQRGINAKAILQNLPIEKLYLVDPYVVYDEYTEWVDSPVWSLENINEIYQDAVSRLKMYTSQIEFVRLYSSVASNVIPNNLDFVYIDGNHNYEYVKQDMECWYPKIKPGGVICGHDLQYPGVTKAFVELAYGKQEVFCGHRSFDCNGVSHCLQPDWWIVKE